MAFVYWIKLPEHTDMFSEGYIGFTSNAVSFRFNQHKAEVNRGTKSYLYNSMRKYGDRIEIITLVSGSDDYCLDLENKLRPKQKIGWNAGIGGKNTMKGFKHSEESRLKMSEASPTKGCKLDQDYLDLRASKRKSLNLKHSEETRKKLSDSRKALQLPPWLNPAATKDVWTHAIRVYNHILGNPGDGQYTTQKKLGFVKDQLKQIVKRIKGGWNPNEDAEYLLWLSEYNKTKDNNGT